MLAIMAAGVTIYYPGAALGAFVLASLALSSHPLTGHGVLASVLFSLAYIVAQTQEDINSDAQLSCFIAAFCLLRGACPLDSPISLSLWVQNTGRAVVAVLLAISVAAMMTTLTSMILPEIAASATGYLSAAWVIGRLPEVMPRASKHTLARLFSKGLFIFAFATGFGTIIYRMMGETEAGIDAPTLMVLTLALIAGYVLTHRCPQKTEAEAYALAQNQKTGSVMVYSDAIKESPPPTLFKSSVWQNLALLGLPIPLLLAIEGIGTILLQGEPLQASDQAWIAGFLLTGAISTRWTWFGIRYRRHWALFSAEAPCIAWWMPVFLLLLAVMMPIR